MNPAIGKSGPASPAWKRGWCLNEQRYKRIRAGPLRNKYAHRVTMERLLGHPIPPGFTVHHMPGIPRYCDEPHNLILMDDRIHRPLLWSKRLARIRARRDRGDDSDADRWWEEEIQDEDDEAAEEEEEEGSV